MVRLDVALLWSSFLSSSGSSRPDIVAKRKGSIQQSSVIQMSTGSSSKQTIEQRLVELGITLPPAPKAAANYAPAVRDGNLLFLSGHLPLKEDGSLMTGRLGEEGIDVAYGYNAARQVGLNLLATMKDQLDGDLDRVEKIVKLFGIVQSTNDFHEQHKVVNGRSIASVTTIILIASFFQQAAVT
jgi:enamine deaminase RidA (YjgF/YER057c/UK114 family)